jgi:hypothetical protein
MHSVKKSLQVTVIGNYVIEHESLTRLEVETRSVLSPATVIVGCLVINQCSHGITDTIRGSELWHLLVALKRMG